MFTLSPNRFHYKRQYQIKNKHNSSLYTELGTQKSCKKTDGEKHERRDIWGQSHNDTGCKYTYNTVPMLGKQKGKGQKKGNIVITHGKKFDSTIKRGLGVGNNTTKKKKEKPAVSSAAVIICWWETKEEKL